MKKNEFLTLCTLLLFCLTSVAQTSNEVLGTSVVETEGTFTTGSSITTGDYNVLIGDGAGSMLTSGLHNTFLGTSAGAQQTTASDNVFIGRFAGYFNIFGTDNVFIGAKAGRLNTGTDNIFIGTEAGENNTSGADNVFVGEESGKNNTEGKDNVFIGEDAGFNNTTADDNTFVGSTAGRSNTTGFRNAFFGAEAGYDNTTGYRNTFVGDSTGIDIGAGRLNTFVGQGAGSATEHANYNTFIGVEAGGDNNRTNTTNSSNRNTYVGTFTGFSNREGEDNVGVGAFANYNQSFDIINITGRWGASASTVTRSRTTFLGAQSYPNNNDVVAIGYQTRVDGSRGIAIGNNSRARQTNSMALGYAVDVNQINTLALGGDLTTNRYSVGIGTVKANLNASLDLADVDKGFLLNRVTTAERTTMETIPASGVALTTTDIGLMVYDTDVKGLFSWDGTMWIAVGNNTDNQELNLTTDVLSISRGVATINLSGYLDNTDAQELSLSGTTLAITGNATTVDLSTLQDGTGTDNQELGIATNILSISGGSTTVDLAPYLDNTDAQELSLTGGSTLGITGSATTIDLSVLQDGTGTDSQNLVSAVVIGNNLTIAIENGDPVTVDLSPILSNLETQNANQQSQIDDLLSRVATIESCACGGTLPTPESTATNRNNSILYQNIPNPFNGTTSIKYYIPYNKNNGAIVFSNNSGQIIDNIKLENFGEQELFFNGDSLASGIYYYTLFVDGRKVDSKKMIID